MENGFMVTAKIYSEVLNQITDPVLYMEPIFDDKGEIRDIVTLYANDSACNLLSVNRDEISGNSLLNSLSEKLNDNIFVIYDSVVKTGICFVKEYCFNVNDKKIWFTITTSKCINGVVVIFKNIDRAVKSEKSLEKHMREYKNTLREIHHRIKNNLQIITSLINLQMAAIENEEAKSVLNSAHNRISAVAMFHEKLHEGNSFETINLNKYFSDLLDFLQMNSYGGNASVLYVVDCDDLLCSTKFALNLGLIVNELAVNAYKYAFRGKKEGKVLVTAKENGDSVLISVEDNGVGLPDGIDFKTSESLGMQIVNALSEQLEAVLEVESSNGTKVTLHLSKSYFEK